MIFEAYDEFRDLIDQRIAPEGCNSYRHIFWGGAEPIVLMNVVVGSRHGREFVKPLLSGSIAEFLADIRRPGSSLFPHHSGAFLMSPPRMNGSEEWKLDAIEGIWVGQSRAAPELKIERFHLKNGQQLIAPREQSVAEANELVWGQVYWADF